MAIHDYYGKKRGTTHLEIYTQKDDGSRVIHRQLNDQEAYDTWHLSYYFKEILSYRKLMGSDQIHFDVLPRKEKNLLLYLILGCGPSLHRIVELGSSLFEMIDGLELVDKYLCGKGSRVPRVDYKNLSYIGIELSDLLASASRLLHPQFSIQILPNVSLAKGRFDLLYDRSVTNYAFETATEVAAFINQFEVALVNFYVSKGESFVSSRLGKTMTYFPLKEVTAGLAKPLYHLFGEKAPGPYSGQDLSMGRAVVEGFFLCCAPTFAQRFMEMSKRDSEVESYFKEKQIVLKEAAHLLK